MAVICPTVTATNPHEYREQMERLAPFAERVHIDLMDGIFAPTRSPGLESAWWLKTVIADLHIMYKSPFNYLKEVTDLAPHLVIVHAEADGDFLEFAEKLHVANIKVGVALLAETSPNKIKPSLSAIDHVLVFSGNLGYHGGQADLGLLEKVKTLRRIKPELEIGWDGGINEQNVAELTQAGVDVLNVGGYIHKAKQPEDAYAKIKAIIENAGNETKTDS